MFFTWYIDFYNVKEIPDELLAYLPYGGEVTFKPGVSLIKLPFDNKVYVVDKDNVLHWLVSPAIIKAIFDIGWGNYVIDVDIVVFDKFTIGDPIIGPFDFNPNLIEIQSGDINNTKGLEAAFFLETAVDWLINVLDIEL